AGRPSAADLRGCEAWRNQSPEHQRVWRPACRRASHCAASSSSRGSTGAPAGLMRPVPASAAGIAGTPAPCSA
ncbi:FecR/PupR family sigma factor regulator, partial [Xylella fastidiosa subsp. multiplex]|nr:FecR/PupR family sigma factor regulator [Xylella fastidiosa subsp. multiplex]